MRVQAKQTLTAIAKFAVAVGLVAWIAQKGAIDFSALKTLLNPLSVLSALALMFGLIFINNQRWLVLLRARGVNVDTKTTLPLSLIGVFFNYAMPGGVGGDLVKGFYLVKDHPENRLAAAMSIVMDRLIGFFVMVLTAVVALSLNWEKVSQTPQLKTLAYALFILFFAFVVGFSLVLTSALQKFRPVLWLFAKVPALERIYQSLYAYRTAPGVLVLAVLLSIFSQFNGIMFTYMVGQMMGVTEIPFLAYCFLVPIGVVAMAIPIAPAGIGVGQAAFYFLFNLYLGYPTQVGPTAITAMQIALFVWGLFGAYFYLRRGKVSPTEAQFG